MKFSLGASELTHAPVSPKVSFLSGFRSISRSAKLGSFVTSALIAGLMGCTGQQSGEALETNGSAGLRALSSNERNQDFDQLLSLFQSFYGPYQFKEKRFGFKIEDLALKLKTDASLAQFQSDEAFAGLVMKMGASLRDGHVQIAIENTSSGILRYKIPIIITPVESSALVADIDAKLKDATNIAVGDEVLSVDNRAPFDYLSDILKYRRQATDLSDRHNIVFVFSRPSYMSEIIPSSPLARLKVKHMGGAVETIDIPWQVVKYNPDVDGLVKPNGPLDLRVTFADDLNSVVTHDAKAGSVDSHILQEGDVNPPFLTPQTQAKFKFIKVYPSDASRLAFGLKDAEKPPIFAALYKHQGKTILLVREASYSQDDFKSDVYLKAYRALLSEYQDLAEVLVLDQTHNPGGSYCSDFYNLFANENDVQAVERMRADRKWINSLKVTLVKDKPEVTGTWDAKQAEAWGQIVENAYDQGFFWAEPIPLFTGSNRTDPSKRAWSKPMLVLIDELAGSCGDIFPMLVKANHRALLFGQTTMGLGGNVEEVGVLPNSRIHIKMTRGLYFPFSESGQEAYVENVGVAPDIEYSHTITDFRNGFVDYVKTFSDRALEQIK